ncbi:L-rhamnose mutarotase [Phycisphaeraceae bacterium D3-23]
MHRVAFALICATPLLIGGCNTLTAGDPVYGPTNPTAEQQSLQGVLFFGSAIELNPEKEQLYRELHADVWPDVLMAIEKANIRNYNIFVADLGGKRYLFSFFEYHGSDPAADFASIAADPTTSQAWWPITDSCQRRLPGTPEGEQWKSLEMLMHID